VQLKNQFSQDSVTKDLRGYDVFNSGSFSSLLLEMKYSGYICQIRHKSNNGTFLENQIYKYIVCASFMGICVEVWRVTKCSMFCYLEPVIRTSSIPTTEAPAPPKKAAPKVPDTRPSMETDDHKARNKDGLHSGQCTKHAASE